MFGNAYIMVVLGIIIAKGLGFYRDMVFAGVFGTGVMADIYFQVFGLVNLIFTGIGMALSTLVIKNLNKAENAGHQKAYVSGFLRKSFLYLICASAVMAVFARQIVGIILPEISGDELILATKLMYVMIPSLIFVVIAYIISGILQNEKVFFITSIMSFPFNVVIILALSIPDVSVFTIGLVTTLGWFLHIVILLPSFYKKKYTLFGKGCELKKNGERNLEIFWIFVSNMMFQLCFYTDRAFVGLSEGMASTFNYASNLFVTISSIFVVAMSTVVFPSISKNYEEGNIGYVNGLMQHIISIMTAIFLPFLLVVGLFGTDIIRLLYERGSFTPEATESVSLIFFIYSLGILGYLSQELFNKVIYLSGKYRYCVIGTIAVVTLNIIINLLIVNLVPEITISGAITLPILLTAICTSVLLICYAVLIAFAITKIVGRYLTKKLAGDVLKILLSGLCALAVYIVFNALMPKLTHGYITFIIPLALCGVTYVGSLAVTGILKALIRKV